MSETDVAGSSSGTEAPKGNWAERLNAARRARREARAHNHSEVVAEGARMALPPNHEALQRRAERAAQREAARNTLEVSAADAERTARLARKRNPDEGFSTYEQATFRQYNRLVKNLKPMDPEKYERQKAECGDAFYGGSDLLLLGQRKDSEAAIDNMVRDVEAQIAKRQKYSRRRTHNDDADIDYINERNAKFNKKLQRFFGEHTAEIKQNLERGTAI